ncbi:MAG: hypothetical protein NC308_05965 [Clostridium sp.]|nr:hypothetical protein [Bacteroides sp.]MCM1198415.1 hypothetical protein [Clostridium sp.]
MSESKAYIRDLQSLAELNNALEYGSDSILKILESVNGYLQGVKDVLKGQLEALENQHCEAQERLAEAEQELSDCEASQSWDEEEHEYSPSCSLEARCAISAREREQECRRKVEAAKAIFDECEYEISRYKMSGGPLTPPGGEKLMENLAKEHTAAASDKIEEILQIAGEYRQHKMSAGSSCLCPSPSEPVSVHCETERPLSVEARKERHMNALEKVIERQHAENCGYDRIADANKVIKCPGCDRPLVACVCKNEREQEYAKERIRIFKKEF